MSTFHTTEASLELKLVFMDDHVVVNVLAPTETVRTIQAELPKLLAATAPPYTDVYRYWWWWWRRRWLEEQPRQFLNPPHLILQHLWTGTARVCL